MILITHDLGVVAGRTDETAVMYAGRFVEKAPTAELFTSVRHPYTQALLRSIPKISDPKHTRLTAIQGRPPDLIDRPTGCSFSPRCPRVQEQCREQAPPLETVTSTGHQVACWFPVEITDAPTNRPPLLTVPV
jgi:peptide/nickel transport system ATP-binding protein